MSEAQEQVLLFQWAKLQENVYPELKLLFHIPNGGKRNLKEAMNLKRQGVKAGVLDIFLPVARKDKHGLWIEMKYGKNRLQPVQRKWYWALIDQGYEVEVCYSADEAIAVIKEYLGVK